MPAVLPVLVGVAVVIVAGTWGLGSYRALTGLRGLVEEAWRQLDEELARRHDLIPDLLRCLRDRVPQACALADAVADARAQALRAAAAPLPGPGPDDWQAIRGRADAEHVLTTRLAALTSSAAGSPQLAADQEFLALHGELRATEGRIAAGRRHFNAAVAGLTTRVDRFPVRWVAPLAGIGPVAPFAVPGPGSAISPAPTPPAPAA